MLPLLSKGGLFLSGLVRICIFNITEFRNEYWRKKKMNTMAEVYAQYKYLTKKLMKSVNKML